MREYLAVSILFGMAFVTSHQAADVVEKPNTIFILVDDMGYSDLGCYGGEIQTPHIDSLAQQGVRFTQMYNTSKCFPSRATLLTGVYAQQCGMSKTFGHITNAVTLGEVLQPAGYRTLASGKHHGLDNLYHRGFDHYYGLRDGASNMWNPGKQRAGESKPGSKGQFRTFCDDARTIAPYTPEKGWYATDAFTDYALQWLDEPECQEQPFFLYLSYTAPHYPLHAWPEDIAKYKGRYDSGYAAIQKQRYQRMVDMKLIDPAKTPFKAIEESVWAGLDGDKLKREKMRMEIYAAMLDRVDQNIGRVLDKLRDQGELENTLIFFASDNGACAEQAGGKAAQNRDNSLDKLGTVGSYEVVGKRWATVSNTPLRNWKNYSHEGGINTPFIVSWPAQLKQVGGFYREPVHFIDVMATLVDLTGASYPETFKRKPVTPMQGVSLLPAFEGKPLNRSQPIFWQWGQGGAVRDGKMKAVFYGKKWELFDLSTDRNESHDLSRQYPEKLGMMKGQYAAWYASTETGKRTTK